MLRNRLYLKNQSSLRTDSSQPPLRGGTLIFKTAGWECAQWAKKFNSD
ncbi:MAG: hypothetical protein MR739_02155 [Spirochaetia bacterium]|nr:hypothetical protein [Spirochaetia bacterium]